MQPRVSVALRRQGAAEQPVAQLIVIGQLHELNHIAALGVVGRQAEPLVPVLGVLPQRHNCIIERLVDRRRITVDR